MIILEGDYYLWLRCEEKIRRFVLHHTKEMKIFIQILD
jgi:hypothetical protein